MLTVWREQSGPHFWRIALQPGDSNLPKMPHNANKTALEAYSAYDLPSVEALIRYFHAAAGYPVRSTWLKAISAGNYSTWPGLTLANATNYCPSATSTIMGHLVHKRQGVRSTKTNLTTTGPQEQALPQVRSNKLHIHVTPISKLYTANTGRFPIHARSGNQYIMIAYHCDTNLILSKPFPERKDTHRLLAYNKIIQRLTDNKLSVYLQILDNEASTEYKRSIKTKWNAKYKLVPPHTHQSNSAERTIHTFKAHFLSILAGVAPDFPRNLWDLLLPQTELTLNLIRQATLEPTRSAWSYFHGPFNYDATPIGLLGCDIITHKKIGTRNSWDFCGAAGWYMGIALQHYCCHTIVAKATRAAQISDIVELRHHHLTHPEVTPMDRIVHSVNKLTCALQDAPPIVCDNQLFAINALHQAIQRWTTSNKTPRAKPPRATSLHPHD